MTTSLPPRKKPSNPRDAPKAMNTSEKPETNATACRNGDGPATPAGGPPPSAIEAAPGPAPAPPPPPAPDAGARAPPPPAPALAEGGASPGREPDEGPVER